MPYTRYLPFLALLALFGFCSNLNAQAPANDNFANALFLPTSSGTVTGNTALATREFGEPIHWSPNSTHSVWFRWVATNAGVVNFNTFGSGFDTVIAAYIGTNLTSLLQIAANDDATFVGPSRILFPAAEGQEFFIAVDGWNNNSGPYVLNWSLSGPPPPPPPPATNTFQFSATEYRVTENTPIGYVPIEVFYGGGATGPVSVTYTTLDGTAQAGRDYLPRSETLTFAVGETNKTFVIPIIDNSVSSGNRAFSLALSNATGGALIGVISNALVTILDDETVPIVSTAGQFQFGTNFLIVTENETSPAVFLGPAVPVIYERNARGAIVTVNRVNGSKGRVLVDYATRDFTAISNIDYVPVSGTLIFDHLQTSTNFVVPIISSGFFFTNFFIISTFQVELSNPRPAPEEEAANPGLIAPTLGSLTNTSVSIYHINDLGSFNFERATWRADEYGNSDGTGNNTVTVDVLYPPGGPASVGIRLRNPGPYRWSLLAGSDYADPADRVFPNPFYTDGTAQITNLTDYVGADTTLNFGNGQQRARYTFTINNDDVPEFNEDVYVELVSLSGQPPVGPIDIANVTILHDDQSAGSLDREWNPDNVEQSSPPFNFTPGANNVVYAVAVQPDQKCVIGGDFTAYNAVFRNRIARILANGAIDNSFAPGNGANGYVSSIALYPASYTNTLHRDKILIAGAFTSYDGRDSFGIARLNVNGSFDPTFNPGNGADQPIRTIAVQSDGKVVIGGEFTVFNDIPRNGIARLNEDGSVDLSFDPGSGTDGPVLSVAVRDTAQSIFVPRNARGTELEDVNPIETGANQGVVTIDYDFLNVPDSIRVYYDGNRLFDLNTNGAGQLNIPYGPGNSSVITIVMNEGIGLPGTLWSYRASVLPLLPDRTIYIGGSFSSVNGEFRDNIARLRDNGSVDLTFNPGGGADNPVHAVAVQPDGKVLIGGSFKVVDFRLRNSIARYNSDGTLDATFDPGTGADRPIYAIKVQPDGKAFIGGLFTEYNQTRRIGLARLMANGLLDTSFMDTAYNQFAGLINTFSFEAPNFVHSIALETNGNLLIGGSFTNVGGNAALEINEGGGWANVWTRQQKRTRFNVARILGGYTPGPGNVEIAFPNYFIDENAGTLSVTLERRDGRLGTAGGDVATSNLLALAAADFTFTKNPEIWPEWQNGPISGTVPRSVGFVDFVYFQFPILDDTFIEGNELLNLGLFNPQGSINLGGEIIPLGAARGRSIGTVTISDNDFDRGTFNFSVSSYTVDEYGTNAILTVIRTNGNNGTASIDYFTRDGTAAAGIDYVRQADTLTFNSGITNLTIRIPIIPDTDVEFEKNFSVVLTNARPPGAILPGGLSTSTATATVTIIDDDFSAGRVNFSSATFSTNENAGQARVTVTRSGGSSGQVFVQVAATNGTARSGIDFIPVTNTLSWSSGDTAPKTLVIPLLTDGIVDSNRTVNLRLFNGFPNGTIGARSTATLTLVDSDSYGQVGFSQSNYEADENGTNIIITVVRTSGIAGTGTVSYLVFDDRNAVNGLDYAATNGTLLFLPGEISKSFSINLINDTVPSEGLETVRLVLTNAVNVVLGAQPEAILTIIDDESSNVPAGSLDVTFNVVVGPNQPVYAMALEPDGDLIIGGDFTTYDHIPRQRLARVLPNGALDGSFNVGVGPNRSVRTMALQKDGKLLIGGFFTRFNQTNRNAIARLNFDGSLDAFFDPGSGADNPVYALAIQPDDRILVGGSFTTINGVPRAGIAMLNTNGTVHLSFNPGLGANGTVYAIALQKDGKIVIGGDFTTVNNIPRPRIARLNPNGSLDESFNPVLGADAPVRTVAVQPDGRILIGGSFVSVNGVERNYLARLNADGSVDTSFLDGLSGGNNAVYSLALQADGKILVGGDFTSFNGVFRNRLTRLTQNGQSDPTINFGNGANGFVNSIIIQPDRKILICGGFTTFDDIPKNYFARLHGGSLAGSGALEFGSAFYVVDEQGSNAVITLRRNGGTSGDVTIDYSSFEITATAGLDYIDVNGTVTFREGETRQTFLIPILDDAIVEEPELAFLTLDNPSNGATLSFNPTAVLTILSDDSQLSFLTATFRENESTVSTNATITIVRTGATNSIVAVDYITQPGTATPLEDYFPVSGSVAFARGETIKTFVVPLLPDDLVEGNETVFLTLTNATPRGTPYNLANATLTIVDDDFAPGEFEFSAPVYVVNEFETNIVITVVRNRGSAGLVSVRFSTLDGTARAGEDYTSRQGTLAFTDDETVKTFNIPITPDYLNETNETVTLVLSDPTGGATLGIITTATLTIRNNNLVNGVLDFTVAGYTTNENSGSAIIRVSRTLGSAGPVSVTYRTIDGTARAGSDYTGVTNTLAWANGDQAVKTFTVPLINDTSVEATEFLNLELLNPVGGAILGTRPLATLTITDEDVGPGFLGFTASLYTAPENGTNAIINVARTFGNTGTVSIAYSIIPGGTAVAGVNYSNVSGILVFGPTETNKTFFIPLIDNTAAEVNKTINIALSNPTGGASTNGQIINALVTIIEDDQQAGSVDASFTRGANDQIYAVSMQTNTSKLYVGGDFTIFDNIPRQRIARVNPNGSLDAVFNAGTNVNGTVRAILLQTDGKVLMGGAFTAVSSNLSFLVRLLPDGSADTNFFPSMTGVDNYVYAMAQQSDGKFIIAGKFTAVNGVARNFIARINNNGAIDPSFNPGTGADAQVWAVAIQSDGKILLGGDFLSVNGVARTRIARLNTDGSVDESFNPGDFANDSVRAISVQPNGRILVGGLFASSNAGVSYNRLTRLNSDGSRDASFDTGLGADEFVSAIALQDDGRILVGGGFTTFNGVPRRSLVRLNANGSVDTTLNLGSGANNYISGIALQPDRKIVVVGAFTEFDGQPRQYIARLNGGENIGPGSIAFSAPAYQVIENSNSVTITVRRLLGTSNTVSIDFDTITASNDTALAGVHYLRANGTLTFASGESVKTFTVPIMDDISTNADRTFTVVLSNPLGGALLGIPSSARVTIVNNDDVLAFALSTYSVSENAGNAIITVQRLGGTVGTVTVDYLATDNTASGGVDYAPTAGTLTFTNGQNTAFFLVPIFDDASIEGNESVNLLLSNPTGTAVLTNASASLTIVDDDLSGGLMGFSIANYTVSERGTNAVITVLRGSGSSGSASVQFTTSNGTATNGLDYQGVSGLLVFSDGEAAKTFTVPIFDDSLVEGAETVNLSLFNPVGATLGQANAILTILGDEAVFDFSQPLYTVSESGTNVTITVLRSPAGTGPVSVDFTTSNLLAVAGLDFIGTNGTLLFDVGETSKTFTVSILHDLLGEGDEPFTLVLSKPQGEAVLGVTSTATNLILDDDISFAFAAPNYIFNENVGLAPINVVRVGLTSGVVSVTFNTSDGTALAGQDYTFTSVVLTFADGETNKLINIPILEDNRGEGNEFLNLNLANPSAGTSVGLPGQARLEIVDNEDVIAFASSQFFVNEFETNAVITLVRTGVPSNTVVTVNYLINDGTARAGLDYTGSLSGTISFALFETVKTFTIPIIDDALAEGDETVNLRLVSASGGITLVDPTNSVLTIVDNDVSLSFGSSNFIASETASNAVISVIRAGATSNAVSVAYRTFNGTGTANADYIGVTNVLTFPPGVTNLTFDVPLLDDLLIEGNETVQLQLFNPTPTNEAKLGTPALSVLTIVDNDASTIIASGAALVFEYSSPANGIVDPGEQVRIRFGLRNIGNVDAANLVATVLPNANVSVPVGEQASKNYGLLVANSPTVSRDFILRFDGTNGSQVNVTFRLQDGARNLGNVTFTFVLGNAPFSFANTSGITLNDNSSATPYPSTITVSNIFGTVRKVTVTLNNVNHTYPDDVDVLLVNPQGQGAILMSDTGHDGDLVNVSITFDDEAPNALPDATAISTGRYRPANYAGPGTADAFPGAPAGPYATTLGAISSGLSPNGVWSLYVVDDAPDDAGNIAGGWTLTITTTDNLAPTADLSVSVTDTPDPILIGRTISYFINVTNHGPAIATGVRVTNALPAGVQFLSATGNCVTNNGTVVCDIGTLDNATSASFRIDARVNVVGSLLNVATVQSSVPDSNPDNNTFTARTTVVPMPALGAIRTADKVLVITWPSAATGFVLESADSLVSPIWTRVTSPAPVLSGNRFTVTINATNAVKFYRLREGS